jgi:hypothetical protein
MSRTNVLLVLILCLILGVNAGFAQGLFITVNAGYSLGSGTANLGSNTKSIGTIQTYDGVYGTYGEGFKFGGSAGYMFSDYLGAELGLSYWLGKTFEVSYSYEYGSVDRGGQKTTGSGFVAVPSILLSANMKTINPYARLGVVLGLLRVKRESTYTLSPGGTYETTEEETGNLAFGFAGALGIAIPKEGAVEVFAELSLQSLSYAPSQSEVTKYTVNGEDRLASLQYKVTEYKESFTRDTSAPLPSNIGQAVRRPFSSIGIVVGARINL